MENEGWMLQKCVISDSVHPISDINYHSLQELSGRGECFWGVVGSSVDMVCSVLAKQVDLVP